ncbi:hypothetical protein L3X38_023567 [Prunus dulcis]|uniref:S-locus lectin protein kinase family protein n=1 Tax=Prunus dulcis TaxID=3755 RepID=A0AAD4W0P1_PRUDU|nr:hypothetical protein L3X38_023567 [Prunus dulcis]
MPPLSVFDNLQLPTVIDSISPLQSILDNTTLVSSDGSFELGSLVQNKSVAWSTSTGKHVQSAMVQLLNSGNLVERDVKDGNTGTYLWQSFDYPSDTLLPGMKLGWDLRTGLKRSLSAQKNSEDPCPGYFTFGIEMGHDTYPEAYIWKGTAKYYRSGPWNGLRFSGAPELRTNPLYRFDFVYNDEVVYTYQTWRAYSSVPIDLCDNYGLCGANGNCIIGCVHNKPLSCQERYKDGFVKFNGLKLPETTHSWVSKSMNLKECKTKCLKNCSCMAYTSSDIRGGGTGCAIWFGDLIDVRQFTAAGQGLYIRMPASELVNGSGNCSFRVLSGVLLVGYFLHRSRRKLKEIGKTNQNNEGKPKEDLELPLFDLIIVIGATNNFSSNNKLGEDEVTGGLLLDWPKRFHIICGIARGLLCLHQDSRLRINHRDLKAKWLEHTVTWHLDGLFSVKSDVFSFDILVLEVISGRKNKGLYHPNHSHSLIGHAWRLWNQGRPLELIDTCLESSCTLSEVLCCIHVSLLCVQHHPEDRPSMSSVVIMLGSEIALAQPKQPSFFMEKESHEAGSSSGNQSSSRNEISITLLEVR